MTQRQFFISDTHFGHKNILTFKNNDGSMLREFDSIEEMDETIIDNWNKTVRPTDKVYHLGDIAMNGSLGKFKENLGRCNGTKILIRGNHDVAKLNHYRPYFKDVRAYKVFPEGFICSHIPIHPESLARWKANVHGHLHGNKVMLPDGTEDLKYISVCCEQIDYTPVDFEWIMEKINGA